MPRQQKNAMKPENHLYSRIKKKTVVDTLNEYNVSEIILATVGANEKAIFFKVNNSRRTRSSAVNRESLNLKVPPPPSFRPCFSA